MALEKKRPPAYNIFVDTNVSVGTLPDAEIARLLALVGQPARIRILLAMAEQETCVCHLEAVTGMRQASISQHLMALRRARLVAPNRAGRNIYYRLARPAVLGLLRQAAQLAGIPAEQLAGLARRPAAGCPCPQCSPAAGARACPPGSACQSPPIPAGEIPSKP